MSEHREHKAPKPTPATEMIIPSYPDPIRGAERPIPPGIPPTMADAPEVHEPGRHELPEGHASYARPGETAPRMEVGHLPSIGTGTTIEDLLEAVGSLFRTARSPYQDPMWPHFRPHLAIAKTELERRLAANPDDFTTLAYLARVRGFLGLKPDHVEIHPSATAGVAYTVTDLIDSGDENVSCSLERTTAAGVLCFAEFGADDPVICGKLVIGATLLIQVVAPKAEE